MGSHNRFLFYLAGVTSIMALLPIVSILITSPPSSKEQSSIDYLHLKESYGGSSSKKSAIFVKKNNSAIVAKKSDIVAKRDGLPTSTTISTTTISTTTSISSSTSSSTSSIIDFQSISEKWQLPKAAIPLLKKIQSRPVGFDYNRTSDILGFRHPLKTGGTSLSVMLQEIFKDRVIPGSAKSKFFIHDRLTKALKNHPPDDESSDDYWRNMAVLYTHTMLRKGTFLADLREKIPVLTEKRFRLMTIVRRPLDLAASSFYETLCRIGQYSGGRNLKDISDCPKINLTDVKLKNIERQQGKCEEKEESTPFCDKFAADPEGAFAHCGSIDVLLESKKVHNKHYRTLMGDLPQPPEMPQSKTPTMDEVSLYTIRDLGGLVDFDEKYKEDFIWFAITERMKESLCLFYYKLKIDPVKERNQLYKACRPLTLWEDRHKRWVEENETFDYTVWRAANAILDVRSEDMRLEIKGRLDAGEKIEEIPYLGPGCYADADADDNEEKQKRTLPL